MSGGPAPYNVPGDPGGVLVHQIDAGFTGFTWIVKSDFVAVIHLEYRLNAELGPYLLYLRVGPALLYPDARFGWFAGLGVGYVFGARGGRAF